MRRTIQLVTTVTLALLGGLLVSVPVAATADDPVVTWPEVTRFNPDLTDYSVTTSDPGGDGVLVAWRSPGVVPQELPHEGTVGLTLISDGTYTVEVTRCPEAYTRIEQCARVSESPTLNVYSEMDLSSVHLPRRVGAGVTEGTVRFRPALVDSQLSWSLISNADGQTHASGSQLVPARASHYGSADLRMDIPEDVPDGAYRVALTMTSDSVEFGRLEGSFGEPVDMYVDQEDGQIVPEGEYQIAITGRDDYGNATQWSGAVEVSHKRIRTVTAKDTIKAARAMTGTPYVGSCSTLAKPAKGEPKGSLGFYSQTKCRSTDKRSVVAAYHGVYLPKAFQGRYSWVRVTLHGGPATKARGNYIVHGYLHPRTKKVIYTRVFRKGDKAHRGKQFDHIWDRTKDRPYTVWYTGLTAGSRYDVRSFTIEVKYQVLR